MNGMVPLFSRDIALLVAVQKTLLFADIIPLASDYMISSSWFKTRRF